MAEPTSTLPLAISLLPVAILSMLPGVDPSMVLGAFSGAVVFVMSSDELSTRKKLGFFLPSFGGGLLAAPMVTGLLTWMLPDKVAVSLGVGSLIASAIVVKTLLWIIANDPASLVDMIKGMRR
jgi:hypothetical protein